jgi:hypothetical protein
VKKPPRKKAVAATKPASASHEDALFARVVDIIESARGHVARSVNTATVQAYWLIGREIVEVEQHGEKRAGYGARVIEGLAKRLAGRVGKGFSAPNLRNMRQFYLTYPEGSALPGALGGAASRPEKRSALPSVSASSKIRSAVPSESRRGIRTAALTVTAARLDPLPRPLAGAAPRGPGVLRDRGRPGVLVDPAARATDRRALLRPAGAQPDPRKVLALARHGQEVATPADVLKEPFVLEFLDLPEHPSLRERDIEQAIIDRLEAFMLELGKGFCFVGARSG